MDVDLGFYHVKAIYIYMISEFSPLIHLMFCIVSNTLGSDKTLKKQRIEHKVLGRR